MSNCCPGPYGCGKPSCGFPTEAALKAQEERRDMYAAPRKTESKHKAARIQRAKARHKKEAHHD